MTKWFLVIALLAGCATPHSKAPFTITPVTSLPVTEVSPFMRLLTGAPPPEPSVCIPVQPLTDIDEEAVERLLPMLRKCVGTPVTLEVDSAGGSVLAGYELIRALEKHGSVTARVDGICASMCLAIVQSANKRTATSRSTLMAHMPMSGVMGKEQDVQNTKERLRVMGIALAHQYCRHASMSFDACKGHFDSKEWWMTPNEALSAGLLDNVN